MNRETQVINPGFPENIFYFEGAIKSGHVLIEVKSLTVANKTRFSETFPLSLNKLDYTLYQDLMIFGYMVRFKLNKATINDSNVLLISAVVVTKPTASDTKHSIKGLILPLDPDEQLFATVTLNY